MNKRTITIILALILLGCFFLPWFGDGTDKVSAYDVVFGKGEMADIEWPEKFLWLLIPLGSILLLIGGERFTGGFAYWLPLMGVLYIFLRIFIEITAHTSAGEAAEQIFSVASWGFWITLVAAVGLVVNKKRG